MYPPSKLDEIFVVLVTVVAGAIREFEAKQYKTLLSKPHITSPAVVHVCEENVVGQSAGSLTYVAA